ncbi:hypothetical protein ACFPA1_21230 [Neobacillus sp. GCM10023253]|uniref:hypothetical protein n=1 Tax=Neobacillus sp. GCM10023253 TaxID=3252644 RepID=UPI00361A0B63
MKKVKRVLFLSFFVSALSATPAFAAHQHYLVTPGQTVCDIGSGQTSIDDPNHGGYHQFHEHVHLGTPGTFAFKQGGQVSVFKGTCPEN